MDAMGRIVVPKRFRDALGLSSGSVVDVSRYGDGLRLVPGGRTARLVESDEGVVVAESETVITDDIVFDLIDSGRP